MGWLARLSAVGVASSLLALPALPAAAEEQPEGTAGAAHEVTLITGDVVEVQQFAGGRQAATVRPGKGREDIRFTTQEVDGDLTITPVDMVPYIARGLVDRRLFAVGDLIEQGYDDAASATLPLILVYGGQQRGALPGVTSGTTLSSVNAQAVAPDKDDLPALWGAAQVRSSGADEPRLNRGLSKIWLDGKIKATLEHSVPQVGAPQAWQDGFDGKGVKVAVLDTGADEEHPDLAGKISDRRDFTDNGSTEDGHGHGTHVAATVAGLGAASEGRRKGVAPGAELIVGKVLDDRGSGSESQILSGMEWAAQSGADVVNMSLGGSATDGTDPLSVGVDTLTEQTGSLFVVAAGNEGGDYTVGTPGAATSALTVGAVDATDALASFSSRGPRLDEAPKPDITAPGVSIIAARAAETALGQPVDDRHTALSGTSMATPHVAGAAAILKQRHPEWRAGQLKDALVSTAKTIPGQSVHQQGGGRLDVTRVVRQGVTATGVIDLGLHEDGNPGTPAGEAVFINATEAPVTLALAASLDNLDGADPAEGAVSLGSPSITVAPGGTAEVPVTVDLAKLQHGRHTGYVTATSADGTISAHTSLALTRRGRMHKVHFTGLNREGEADRVPVISMYGASQRDDVRTFINREHEGTTVEVAEGTYMTQAIMGEDPSEHPVDSLVVIPELKVTGDLEVVLDARKAHPVKIKTAEPVIQEGISTYFTHRAYGSRKISQGAMNFPSVEHLAVTPTEPVKNGTFEFASRWQLAAPRVTAKLAGSHENVPMRPFIRSPEIDGRKRWPLVDGGKGTPEELAKLDLKGRAVVVASGMTGDWDRKIDDAAAAGAAAIVVVGREGGAMWQPYNPTGDRDPLPSLNTTFDHGRKLLEKVRAGNAVLEVTGAFASPYLYDVMQVSQGHIPAEVVHEVNWRNTARVDSGYHEYGGFGWGKDQRYGWRPWQTYSLGFQMETQRIVRTPLQRAEYVSAGDTQWQHVVQHMYTWESMSQLRGGLTEQPQTYQPGKVVREDWFGAVVRPAVPAGVAQKRTGDTLSIHIPEFVDSSGHYGYAKGSGDKDTASARFYRNGELVAERPNLRGDFPAVAEEAEYRLELSTTRTSEEWRYATATETAWTFKSKAADTTVPLLKVDYDIPADLNGQVRRALPVPLKFTAGPSVKSFAAEHSYDDGKTWKRLHVLPIGNGRYSTLVSHPAVDGGVSLRVTATDTAGNQIKQTVTRAYGVR
ncbi:S8 family serine peptidase [Streptosporangium soli]|nr:S8 family serine peptidase [Streptosporangium sp. KLBMP 9127]